MDWKICSKILWSQLWTSTYLEVAYLSLERLYDKIDLRGTLERAWSISGVSPRVRLSVLVADQNCFSRPAVLSSGQKDQNIGQLSCKSPFRPNCVAGQPAYSVVWLVQLHSPTKQNAWTLPSLPFVGIQGPTALYGSHSIVSTNGIKGNVSLTLIALVVLPTWFVVDQVCTFDRPTWLEFLVSSQEMVDEFWATKFLYSSYFLMPLFQEWFFGFYLHWKAWLWSPWRFSFNISLWGNPPHLYCIT